jgi:hypothetical protein
MNKQATTAAALERLEGIAADFLETNIAVLEKSQGVSVKDVDVAVVPGPSGTSPVVTVEIELSKPGTRSQA